MTPHIDGRLKAWRRQRFLALWAAGGARLAAYAGAAVLAAGVADRLVGLPRELREGLLAVGAAALAFGAARWLFRPLRLLDPGLILDAAAQRWPQARGLLRSAWELARAPLSPSTSAALAERHLEAAERAAAGLPDETLFPVALDGRLKRRLGGVLCLWAGAMPLLGPRPVARVLAPWLEAPLESELEVKPGDARVPWASAAELSARWRAPGAGGPLELELRRSGGGWTPQPWDASAGGASSFRAESLTSPLEYRLVSRDRRSRVFTVTPVPFPRFTRLTARVQRPGGSSVELALDGASEVEALRGSWVAVRGVPDRALEKAWLEVSSLGGPVPMKPGPDGSWEAGFPLQQDGTLRVRAEAEGLSEPDPPAFQLRALEDHPPEVALLSPAFPVETSRRERLPVAFEARDDFGLSALALVYKVNGGPERILPLPGPKPGATSHLGEYSWDLAGFPDQAKVEFRVRATDNARPQPQTGVSQPGLVVLADFEGQHARAAAQWLGAQAELGKLAEKELDMSRALADAAARPEEQRAAKAGELASRDAELAQSWEKTQSALAELADDSEKDPYANPGAADDARGLSQALEAMKQGELAPARAAQKAGDLAQAGARHAELAKRVQRAGERLAAGRELQAMQDFWAETQRMDQAGQEAAQALEQMAKGRQPSAEEKRQLESALESLRKEMESLAKAIEAMPKVPEGSEADKARKVYTVPLNKALANMDSLQAALARGDYKEAARLARELARSLKATEQAVSRAAQDFAESSDQSPTKRLDELGAAWKEAADKQERALDSVSSVEESRLSEKVKQEKDLLARLAAEQKAAVAEGERLGAWMPPGALPDMRAALAELAGGTVREAPNQLGRAAAVLDGQSKALSPQGQPPPQPAQDLGALSAKERDILERLRQGARNAPMTDAQRSAASAAGAEQRQASQKADGLEPLVEGVSRDYGLDMRKASGELSAARAEQQGAEAALSRQDTAEARAAQARALEHLRKGQEEAQQAQEQAQASQSSASRPFGQPRATTRPMGRARGRSGADTGFVPLPGVEEYQPPRVIRGEVEKSLQEKRPPAFDKAVDEYLKHLSQ